MKVTKIGGALGARVSDTQVGSLSASDEAELRLAFATHQVLFIVDQALDPDALSGFGALWGTLHPLRHAATRQSLAQVKADNPYVGVITAARRADKWHTDFTYRDEPNVATLLQALSGPEVGGDTIWASLSSAYRSLSSRMKVYLDGLIASHSGALVGQAESIAEHPVVRVHPETGQPALYVNRHYTTHVVGMARCESQALLSYLFSVVEEPHITCRWQWSPGDVCIWDNRCTQHIAVNDYGQDEQRDHYHVSVAGDRPEIHRP